MNDWLATGKSGHIANNWNNGATMRGVPLIDTHCHIDDPVFDPDREARLQRCQDHGLQAIIVPAIHQAQWATQAQIVAESSLLHGAYGLHPCYMDKHALSQVTLLEAALADFHAVAVGEIGLDFFINPHDVADQLQLFEAQVAVARNLQLPVILHARKSHDLMLKVLRQAKLKGGIVHAFSGSLQQAQIFVDLGFLIGFGGGATYDRANKLHTILRNLPLTAIALETDAPDIPPSFSRDQPNTPENLRHIATLLAEIKGVPLQDLAQETTRNAVQLFQLSV